MKTRDIYRHLLLTAGICTGPCRNCNGCDHIDNHDDYAGRDKPDQSDTPIHILYARAYGK